MIQKDSGEQSLFDKANDAAKHAMQSVVDLAARTRTPVIVFRNGRIEHIEPDLLKELPHDTSVSDQRNEGKGSH